MKCDGKQNRRFRTFSGKYHGKLNDKKSQLMWIVKKLTRWNDPLFLLTGGAEAVESVSRIKVPLQLVRLAWLPKYSRKNSEKISTENKTEGTWRSEKYHGKLNDKKSQLEIYVCWLSILDTRFLSYLNGTY